MASAASAPSPCSPRARRAPSNAPLTNGMSHATSRMSPSACASAACTERSRARSHVTGHAHAGEPGRSARVGRDQQHRVVVTARAARARHAVDDPLVAHAFEPLRQSTERVRRAAAGEDHAGAGAVPERPAAHPRVAHGSHTCGAPETARPTSTIPAARAISTAIVLGTLGVATTETRARAALNASRRDPAGHEQDQVVRALAGEAVAEHLVDRVVPADVLRHARAASRHRSARPRGYRRWSGSARRAQLERAGRAREVRHRGPRATAGHIAHRPEDRRHRAAAGGEDAASLLPLDRRADRLGTVTQKPGSLAQGRMSNTRN